jgi:hypothetical protein
VPLFWTGAGTAAATLAFLVTFVVLAEVELFLLLPQPATATRAKSATASAPNHRRGPEVRTTMV